MDGLAAAGAVVAAGAAGLAAVAAGAAGAVVAAGAAGLAAVAAGAGGALVAAGAGVAAGVHAAATKLAPVIPSAVNNSRRLKPPRSRRCCSTLRISPVSDIRYVLLVRKSPIGHHNNPRAIAAFSASRR